nr:hypothetical protein [Streptomyces sp.]
MLRAYFAAAIRNHPYVPLSVFAFPLGAGPLRSAARPRVLDMVQIISAPLQLRSIRRHKPRTRHSPSGPAPGPAHTMPTGCGAFARIHRFDSKGIHGS